MSKAGGHGTVLTPTRPRGVCSVVWSRISGYGIALGAVAIALLVRLAMDATVGDRQPFTTFYLAVIATSLYAGLGPALLALVVSYLTADWFFIPPRFVLGQLETSQIVGSGSFFFVGFTIAYMTHALRAAEAATAARAAALHESEGRFRRLVESNVLGVVFWEDQGRINDANDAFLRMVDRSADELRAGRLNWRQLVPPDRMPAHEAAMTEMRATGACAAIESEVIRADGSRVEILCAGTALSSLPLRGVTWILDITDRKRLENALRASEEYFRELTQSMPIVVWTSRADASIDFVNRQWLEFTGQSLALVRSGSDAVFEVLHPDDRAEAQRTYYESLHEGHGFTLEARIRRASDGAYRWFLARAVPLRDDAGRLLKFLGTATDIDDRKAAEAERAALLVATQQARADAEAANRSKDEFLAMLGHELRNPLSAVRHAIATARLDDGLRPRALEIAARSTEQLTRLIDDLLDVARVTHGRIALRVVPTPLRGAVERAIDTVRASVEERGHVLTVTFPDDEILLSADPARLEQVIVNLLTNAAKYTPFGGHIQLTVARAHGDVVVRVRDDGIGIAPEMLPRIFDLFAQGERTLDRSQGGLGIGLTVVRRLVELHGGRVEAHSGGVGQGAEFVVTLPIPAARAMDALTPAGELPNTSPERARVLLVEDNADAAESLAMLLDLMGHEVRVAADGAAGVAAAIAHAPDVMIIDIGLPGMDGFEVARQVRAQPALAAVGLIALTGYGGQDDRRRTAEAGFHHHLVKPADPQAIEGIIDAVVLRMRGEARTETIH